MFLFKLKTFEEDIIATTNNSPVYNQSRAPIITSYRQGQLTQIADTRHYHNETRFAPADDSTEQTDNMGEQSDMSKQSAAFTLACLNQSEEKQYKMSFSNILN